MSYSFLGENYQPLTVQERRSLAYRIKSITDQDRVALQNDLSKMSADDLFHFVEALNGVIPLPQLVTMAIDALPNPTGLNYNYTLSMINIALKAPHDEAFDKAAIITGIATLIKGYVHRTNMNLLEGVVHSLSQEAKLFLSGNHEIDDAFVEHLGRALTKKFDFRQADNIIFGLRELDIPKSFETFLKVINTPEQTAVKDRFLSDFYHAGALKPSYIKIIRAELGDQPLINLARANINQVSGIKSLVWIIAELTEEVVINQATLEKNLADFIKRNGSSAYFTNILNNVSHTSDLVKSKKFVLDNIATLIALDPIPPCQEFSWYAKEQNRGAELVSHYLSKAGTLVSRLDAKNNVPHGDRFDVENASPGKLLSELFNPRYSYPEGQDIVSWRQATVGAITKTGVIEFADSLADITEPAAMAIYKDMGNVPNREEILKKFMKIREVAFCDDLGM